MCKVQISMTYHVYVPVKLGKERSFLEKLEEKGVRTDSTEILSCTNGVEISVHSDTLKEMDMTIETYTYLLVSHSKYLRKN